MTMVEPRSDSEGCCLQVRREVWSRSTQAVGRLSIRAAIGWLQRAHYLRSKCPCKRLGASYNPFRPRRLLALPLPDGSGGRRLLRAGVAQLVEHDVANVVVVGSNPIARSIFIYGGL